MPNLARSVPKPLKVLSLARSVLKPLKVPSLVIIMLFAFHARNLLAKLVSISLKLGPEFSSDVAGDGPRREEQNLKIAIFSKKLAQAMCAQALSAASHPVTSGVPGAKRRLFSREKFNFCHIWSKIE